MKDLLSIGIPTYNRPKSLERRIQEIERLVRNYPETRVLVSDNSSSEPSDKVREMTEAIPQLSYWRNKANIGGGANFMKIIEHCDTEWLWFRGDDDPMFEKHLDTVIKLVSRLPENVLFIVLSPRVDKMKKGSGLKGVIEMFSDVRAVGWISVVAVRVSSAKESLRWGYQGIGSAFPIMALIFGVLRDHPDGRFVIFPIQREKCMFRDGLDETAPPWNFIETMISKSSRVSDVFPEQLRKKYYREWVKIISVRQLFRALIGIKIGYYNPETISWMKVFPLLAGGVKGVMIAVFLCGLGAIPSNIFWLAVSIFNRTNFRVILPVYFQESFSGMTVFECYRNIRKLCKKKRSGEYEAFI